ncbi:MAG: glycosyltransferase [Nanoarchaeota archaeon]|nr:glycosyltransferase [Nanoarchaeota archaeon]MBU1135223.1 glycosyltransferase [Nanoarchaeota archaeon]MBU2519860.1 glycosyltransferase [Nanoarchaeota archaeon]
MKILHLNFDLGTKVEKNSHGGIENFIYNLHNALLKRGYDSDVLARYDSKVDRLIVFNGNYTEDPNIETGEDFLGAADFRYCADFLQHVHDNNYDIIHSHARPLSVFSEFVNKPIVTTLHLPVNWFWYKELGDINHHENKFVAVSNSQIEPYSKEGIVVNRVIYNGVPVKENHPFSETHGDYLLYLGRMSKGKGPHIAIDVAKKLDMPLKIAGGYSSTSETTFFNEFIKPRIGDKIEYLGHVGECKEELYMNAKCLLFPSILEESFGLVPVEAGMTGTPTICFSIGATPEIIIDNTTGFLIENVGDVDAMCEAVSKIEKIDRNFCRKNMIDRFSLDSMVSNYIDLYEEILR